MDVRKPLVFTSTLSIHEDLEIIQSHSSKHVISFLAKPMNDYQRVDDNTCQHKSMFKKAPNV